MDVTVYTQVLPRVVSLLGTHLTRVKLQVTYIVLDPMSMRTRHFVEWAWHEAVELEKQPPVLLSHDAVGTSLSVDLEMPPHNHPPHSQQGMGPITLS